MRKLTNVLGVPVDDVTMDETLDCLVELVEDGRATDRFHQIATVNVDFVVNAIGDPDLMDVLQDVSLALPDGMPIVWASRVLGTRLRQRVSGADLVEALAGRAAESGYRMYLFGSAPGIATRAAELLVERFPTLQVVADAGPSVDFDGTMNTAHLEQIEAARPDIVCVVLGNPKQEYWIKRYGLATGASVLIGVGGTLDLLVGDKQRAPAWMQQAGLEWVFRAGQEPRRLVRRYAIDVAVFLPRVARQAWVGRRRVSWPRGFGGRGGEPNVSAAGTPMDQRLDREAATAIGIVDVDNAPDNATTNLLVSVAADCRRQRSRLVVRSASHHVRRRLADLGVEKLFVFEA